MRFSVSSNVEEVIGSTARFVKQMRFATAVALTKTGKDVQAALYGEMRGVFDRPTSYTLRSLFLKPATRDDLTAVVQLKDQELSKTSRTPDDILGQEFKGGYRMRKGIERYAERAGLISASEYLVPGAGARLDSFGNMSRGQTAQVMSQLRLGLDPTSWATKSARSKRNQKRAGEMFWSRGGHLARGAWLRRGRAVLPVLIVVDRPHYQQRIDIPSTGASVTASVFDRHLTEAVASAWATAR
ncbi:hypothetical protein [Methylibium sp.]|uniref:hypothetical protein n=1 Tax=Methylibium sp. TaxID=2067992 RepID=UPI003D125C09